LWYKRCLGAWRWRDSKGGSKVKCVKCRRKDTVVGEKISKEEKKKILCPEYRTEKRKPWWNWGMVAWPIETKVQQSSMQTEVLKGTARERSKQREVRKMFKILREVWLNIRVKKIDIHKGIIVKALLDSGTTGMFMDRKMAAKHRFKLQKLERLVIVRNINEINNSMRAIMY